jgi:uncharacterized membrane protein
MKSPSTILSGVVGTLVMYTTQAQAAPQFTVLDLGRTDHPGSGLLWHAPEPMPNFDQRLGLDGTLDHVFVYESMTDTSGGTLGDAVGSSFDPLGYGAGKHAVRWHDTTPTDLGTLPNALGNMQQSASSEAYAMNSIGEAVGWSDVAFEVSTPGPPQHPIHAVLWDAAGIHDLGTLATQNQTSWANAINDSHEIVGQSYALASADGSHLVRAFLYAGGTMYNLSFLLVNAPDIRLTTALSIDCQGNIAAQGYDTSVGTQIVHSYLLLRQGPARSCPQQ